MRLATSTICLVIAMVPALGNAVVILDNSSLGFYNSALGTVLNGPSPVVDDNGVNTFLFPNNNSNPNDPLIASTPEPDLSAASAILGNWLSDPTNLNANWSGLQAIPLGWTVNHETAVIYEIDAGAGLSNTSLQLDIGVDNGAFVWLNGVFLGGQMAPGGASLGELSLALPDLSGQNFLQVLREDHGGGTGYSIRLEGDVTPINPVPEPGTLALFCAALFGRGFARRKTLRT